MSAPPADLPIMPELTDRRGTDGKTSAVETDKEAINEAGESPKEDELELGETSNFEEPVILSDLNLFILGTGMFALWACNVSLVLILERSLIRPDET